MKIILLDTTLRDGEQTSGVSFTSDEKLSIAKLLLEELKVDRLEVASAKVSEGEFQAVKKITNWARENGHIDKIEVLGFVDGVKSVNWLKESGCKVLNLLAKGSENHCKYQLKKTPEEHFKDIIETIKVAHKNDISVNIYLEDWSNGMRNSKDYVFKMINSLKDIGIKRFMLPDTLGILNPDETLKFLSEIIKKYPDLKFDFHSHNDYDLAAANVFAALKSGIDCIHGTINGLGERTGNVPISTIIALVNDHFKFEMNVDESKLSLVSKMVEIYSGIHIPQNKPIIGENVFTQTAGIHADGDMKHNLYFNDILPERFGRKRSYALGKTSGKANIKKNLEEIGIELDDVSLKKVTAKIIELGDKKEMVTQEDLPYIISDVLQSKSLDKKIKVENYSFSIANGLKPVASIKLNINDKTYEDISEGDGQYDAIMKAIKKIYNRLGKTLPKLINYKVSIPPGGKTDALVQTIISWQKDKKFKTRGLDSDQTVSAIKATLKMLNIIEEDYLNVK
ncbi:MAG: 2-isopropylmalate synthase [Chlorobi bacterium]|nr:2-isopropylmalate synthase [Chlorobiota bacterium]